MSETGEAVITALLAATPEPPPVTTDASEVVSLAEAMAQARALVLDELAARGIDHLPRHEHAASLEVLRDRDTRWTAALTRARHQLAERVASVARISRASAYVR